MEEEGRGGVIAHRYDVWQCVKARVVPCVQLLTEDVLHLASTSLAAWQTTTTVDDDEQDARTLTKDDHDTMVKGLVQLFVFLTRFPDTLDLVLHWACPAVVGDSSSNGTMCAIKTLASTNAKNRSKCWWAWSHPAHLACNVMLCAVSDNNKEKKHVQASVALLWHMATVAHWVIATAKRPDPKKAKITYAMLKKEFMDHVAGAGASLISVPEFTTVRCCEAASSEIESRDDLQFSNVARVARPQQRGPSLKFNHPVALQNLVARGEVAPIVLVAVDASACGSLLSLDHINAHNHKQQQEAEGEKNQNTLSL